MTDRLQRALSALTAASAEVAAALAETSRSSLALLAKPEAVMANDMQPLLLNTTETARLLGIHARTLARMRAANEGPKALKLRGTSVRYRRRDVERWLEGKRS